MPHGEPFDPVRDYPVSERRADLVVTTRGRPISEVTVDAVMSGEIGAGDLRISPEALERQAEVAAAAGRPALVPNFRRAAELTSVPDERLLEMYEALRPRRSTKAQLEAIAHELESVYRSPLNAALVREAIDAYERRGLLLSPAE
jgi:propanediol dehydratase small subunit